MWLSRPPSTVSTAPVTWSPAGDASWATSHAISRASPSRSSGTVEAIASTIGLGYFVSSVWVANWPAAIALSPMPCGARLGSKRAHELLDGGARGG